MLQAVAEKRSLNILRASRGKIALRAGSEIFGLEPVCQIATCGCGSGLRLAAAA